MSDAHLQQIIEQSWDAREALSPNTQGAPREVVDALQRLRLARGDDALGRRLPDAAHAREPHAHREPLVAAVPVAHRERLAPARRHGRLLAREARVVAAPVLRARLRTVRQPDSWSRRRLRALPDHRAG